MIAAEEVSVTQNCSNCSDYNATVSIDAHAHIHMRTRERLYLHVRSLERAHMRMQTRAHVHISRMQVFMEYGQSYNFSLKAVHISVYIYIWLCTSLYAWFFGTSVYGHVSTHVYGHVSTHAYTYEHAHLYANSYCPDSIYAPTQTSTHKVDTPVDAHVYAESVLASIHILLALVIHHTAMQQTKMHTCRYTSLHTFPCIHDHALVKMYVHTNAHTHVYICAHVYRYVMHISTHISTHMSVNTSTHIF